MEKSYIQIFKDSVLKSSIEYLQEGMGAYSTSSTIREALKDSEFAEAVIRKNPRRAIELMPKEFLKENPNLYAIAMEKDPDYMHYVPMSAKKQNPELCIKIVKENPWRLQDMPSEMQQEYAEEILDVIAEKSTSAIRFLSDTIKRENPAKCMEIVKKNPSALKYIPDEMQEENEETIKDIIKESPSDYRYLSNNIKQNNPDMSIEALKADPGLMGSIPPSILKENIEVCKEIVEKNEYAYHMLPEELKGEIEEPDWYNLKGISQRPEELSKELHQEKELGKVHELAKVTKSKFAQIHQKTKGHLKGAIENLKSNFVATIQEVLEIPGKIKGLPSDIKEMYTIMKQIPGEVKDGYKQGKIFVKEKVVPGVKGKFQDVKNAGLNKVSQIKEDYGQLKTYYNDRKNESTQGNEHDDDDFDR